LFAPCDFDDWNWMGCWWKSSDSSCICFASISGSFIDWNWYLLRSLAIWKIDISRFLYWCEMVVFLRSLCWTLKWSSSSGPSACKWILPGPSADWKECLFQVPLLNGVVVFLMSFCWTWNGCLHQVPLLIECLHQVPLLILKWNRFLCLLSSSTSVEGLKGFQIYLIPLNLIHWLVLKSETLLKLKQIKLEIEDENLLVFEEFWLANVTWFSNQNSSLYCASYLGFHN